MAAVGDGRGKNVVAFLGVIRLSPPLSSNCMAISAKTPTRWTWVVRRRPNYRDVGTWRCVPVPSSRFSLIGPEGCANLTL